MSVDKLTIEQINQILQQESIEKNILNLIKNDTRVTVCKLLKKWENKQKDMQRVQELYHYEYEFFNQGYEIIAGVDEAGRGPLAGPVFVAAVILPLGMYIPKINDSKKLTSKTRDEIYKIIINHAISIKREMIDAETIDKINIYKATQKGMYQVIDTLIPKPTAVLIDAMPLEQLHTKSLSLIKGDAKSATIAAASIVAKVERDRLMDEFDQKYPLYGFAKHKGYGTPEHLDAICKYGPCPIHRKTFEPIKSWRKS